MLGTAAAARESALAGISSAALSRYLGSISQKAPTVSRSYPRPRQDSRVTSSQARAYPIPYGAQYALFGTGLARRRQPSPAQRRSTEGQSLGARHILPTDVHRGAEDLLPASRQGHRFTAIRGCSDARSLLGPEGREHGRPARAVAGWLQIYVCAVAVALMAVWHHACHRARWPPSTTGGCEPDAPRLTGTAGL